MLVKSQVKKKSNYQKFSNVQKITFGFCILFFLGLLSYFSIDEWLRLKGFKKTEFLEDPISYSKSIPINFLKSISICLIYFCSQLFHSLSFLTPQYLS